MIDAGSDVHALAFFVDPATGAPRLACGCFKKVRIVDPAAGGAGLVALEGHTEEVRALTVFGDPATGTLRLASVSGSYSDRSVHVWDLITGGLAEPCGYTEPSLHSYRLDRKSSS